MLDKAQQLLGYFLRRIFNLFEEVQESFKKHKLQMLGLGDGFNQETMGFKGKVKH